MRIPFRTSLIVLAGTLLLNLTLVGCADGLVDADDAASDAAEQVTSPKLRHAQLFDQAVRTPAL